MSLAKLISERFIKYRNLYALLIENKHISYQELIEKANPIVNYIHSIEFNGAIGIVGQRTFSSYIGILACVLSETPFIPINLNQNSRKIRSLIKRGKIKMVISDLKSLEKLDNKMHFVGKAIIPTNEIGNKTFSNNLEVINPEFLSPFPKTYSKNHEDINPLAYIYFTSGSTGEPKGVKVMAKNLLSFLDAMSEHYIFKPGFRASQTFDLSFDPAISDIFFTWSNGGVLCVIPENELMLPFDYIRREKIQFWNSVPTLGLFMMNLNLLKENVFPSLIHSTFCGEQFPQKLADTWKLAAPNSTVENLYGPTETTIYISRYNYVNPKKKFKNSIVPIGKPLKGQSVAIVDEHLKALPDGEVGQLIFSGSQLTAGYLDDNEKTDISFKSLNLDGGMKKWYLTGDRGFFNKDSDLECVGRIDNQVKVAGRRIEIGEIEDVFFKSGKIKDIVVIPLKNTDGSTKALYAFSTSDVKIDELRDYLLENIEKVFIPKKIFHINKIPLTNSGKIDRNLLLKELKKKISL